MEEEGVVGVLGILGDWDEVGRRGSDSLLFDFCISCATLHKARIVKRFTGQTYCGCRETIKGSSNGRKPVHTLPVEAVHFSGAVLLRPKIRIALTCEKCPYDEARYAAQDITQPRFAVGSREGDQSCSLRLHLHYNTIPIPDPPSQLPILHLRHLIPCPHFLFFASSFTSRSLNGPKPYLIPRNAQFLCYFLLQERDGRSGQKG